ncbi:MAG: hypothetical protein IJL17_13560 [Kiritimatiellae bacterium]|nr:hypothetical protein [Kiritimatiellia bacterium]
MNAKRNKKSRTRRVLLVALAVGALLLAGCKTEQMKSTPFYEGHDVTYTGSPEDRVNLWPLAYWREPVGSVLWPMFSFSDDHFAFRPLYSHYGAEHNFLWPFGQYDTADKEGRVFPVFWGEHYFDVFPVVWNHRDFHSLFPLVFYTGKYFTLFPIVWWDIDDQDFTLFPVFGHNKERDWIFPLYYHDDNLTLATPLFGMNGKGASWLLPLYYYDDNLTYVTPFFGMSQQGDSWLIPLYASVGGDFLSPLWCGGSGTDGGKGTNSWWCAPPLLSWGADVKGAYDNRYLLGLAGHAGSESFSQSWLVPLYYGDSDGTFVTPIYGQTKESHWTFPVWYKSPSLFASWFWCERWNKAGEMDWWFVPPLLTGGGRDKDGESLKALMGLAGATWDGPDGFRRSWCFPLWYESSKDLFVTPLFGRDEDSKWILPIAYWDSLGFVTPLWWQTFNPKTGDTDSWMIPPLLTGGGADYHGNSYFYSPLGGYSEKKSGMFPLWYKGPNGFYSLPYCQYKDRNAQTETTCIPPLLSWHSSSAFFGSEETRVLLGLYGRNAETNGIIYSEWALPLFYRVGDENFMTLLAGRKTSGDSVDHWWLTPFIGTTTGSTSGFWFGPFVSWNAAKELPQLENMMNAEKLDSSIVGKVRKERDWSKKGFVTNDVFRVDGRIASETLQFNFETAGRTHTIYMDGGDNYMDGGNNATRYGRWSLEPIKNAAGKLWREGKERTVSFDEKIEFGNRLLYGGERERVVNFDYDTKEKVFDGEVGEALSLFGLVWSARDEKFSGHDYSKRALFWRLYHREELNGDATTDMFPFITRDAKKDGYTNTSFLWRLFRYENDPKKGTSLDFLFIPLMRP